MRNFIKKAVLLVIAAIIGTSGMLFGCGNGDNGGSPTALPETNLAVLAFDGDEQFTILADRPPTPNEEYLRDYKAAGFTHYNLTEDDYRFTNADGVLGTEDDGTINPQYLNAISLCDELGLKVVIRNYYKDADYFCNDDDGIRELERPSQGVTYRIPKRNITNELTSLNAVDGYYMGDEPTWLEIGKLSDLVTWYNQYGGNTLWHFNLLQSYGSFLFDDEQGVVHSFQEYVDYYCEEVLSKVNGPKTLGTDYYPLVTDRNGNAYIMEGILYDYFVIAEKVKEMRSDGHDVLTNFCIQAYAASDKRTLTSTADITFQTNLAMAFGTKSLQYYLYRGTDGDDGIVNQATHGKTALYDYVKEANEQAQNVAGAILNFDWVGTKVYKGQQLSDLHNAEGFNLIADKTMSNFALIGNVSSRLDTLISELQDKDGNKGYMVVNYSEPSFGQTDYVNISFSKKINKAVIYIDGVRSVVDVADSKLQLKLGAGSGAFVYPVYEGVNA